MVKKSSGSSNGSQKKKGDAKVKKSGSRVEEMEAELKDLEEKLKWALADFQNYKRRVEEERESVARLSNVLLVQRILDCLDDFERALSHKDKDSKEWEKGLDLIHQKMRGIVEEEGCDEVDCKEGDKFDPAVHEAVGTIPGEKENTVAQIVRKGYKIGDRIIRPTRVMIYKKE